VTTALDPFGGVGIVEHETGVVFDHAQRFACSVEVRIQDADNRRIDDVGLPVGSSGVHGSTHE